MFTMDMPDVPPQYAQVIVVQAGKPNAGAAKFDRTVAVCDVLENPPQAGIPGRSAQNSVTPVHALRNYFRIVEKREITDPATVTVLEGTKHGALEDRGTFITRQGAQVDTGERKYRYLPAPEFLGKDRAVFLVEMAGMKIRVVYTFHVEEVVAPTAEENLCPESYRRISLETDIEADPLAFASSTRLISYFGNAPSVDLVFSDLPGTASLLAASTKER